MNLNRPNLEKLAAKLESLPEDYGHFSMGVFFNDFRVLQEDVRRYAEHNGGVDQFPCGTVACAVGHGPAAGVVFEAEDFGFGGAPDWPRYSKKFVYYDGFASENPEWHWLFGFSWKYTDPHHYGAAARIRFLLAGNEVPEDFGETFTPLDEHVALYQEFRK